MQQRAESMAAKAEVVRKSLDFGCAGSIPAGRTIYPTGRMWFCGRISDQESKAIKQDG
ncbi:MAG: hypothetical protein P4L87_12525 [Formivibrio sp.]|nr:hypothetical protein [Formivibrio sp.]